MMTYVTEERAMNAIAADPRPCWRRIGRGFLLAVLAFVVIALARPPAVEAGAYTTFQCYRSGSTTVASHDAVFTRTSAGFTGPVG
ncbi:MAG: hypothetical protein ACRDKH_04185, partial [Solirubrobacterales bacterium]